MDALLLPETGDYAVNRSVQGLENELYIRLITPLGTWFADPALGSRLHELKRQKDLPRLGRLAVQYAEQALQAVLDGKRARRIDVSLGAKRRGRLYLIIEAEDMGGKTANFELGVGIA